MDFDTLIDQITAKVAARIAEAEMKAAASSVNSPKILVLSESQDNRCHDILAKAGLDVCYQADCAGIEEKPCDFGRYEAVVLLDLTVGNLSRIGAGLVDSPYTRLAAEAILSGQSIFVPKEEIELFRYQETAPQAYYQMMCGKLNLLAEAGVTFCQISELETALAEGRPAGTANVAATSAFDSAPATVKTMAQRQWEVTKRVATEKDVNEACLAGATCLLIGAKTIVTDLAKDRAKTRGLTIHKKQQEAGK